MQLAEMTEQICLEDVGHLAVVAVGAAQRLGNDVVDDTQSEQVASREFQVDRAAVLFDVRHGRRFRDRDDVTVTDDPGE